MCPYAGHQRSTLESCMSNSSKSPADWRKDYMTRKECAVTDSEKGSNSNGETEQNSYTQCEVCTATIKTVILKPTEHKTCK
jgi:hypothetical protein